MIDGKRVVWIFEDVSMCSRVLWLWGFLSSTMVHTATKKVLQYAFFDGYT